MKNKKNITITIVSSIVAVILIAMVIMIIAVLPKNIKDKNKDTDTDTNTESIITTEDTTPETEPNPPSFLHSEKIGIEKLDGKTENHKYINPLTGLGTDTDLSNKRPAAIMINNIRVACPQIGISNADIMYELLAEGGITRLLMVSLDYENLDVVGSVRSSREYYIDCAQNHDAIYVHAGGSEEAYSQIKRREIDHLDGVNADKRTGTDLTGRVFYRDKSRISQMGFEHSMMTTGENIAKGISIMKYRTNLYDGFKNPVSIIDNGWEVKLLGEDARHIKIVYSNSTSPEYIYDSGTNTYYRYQFNKEKHIDGATGEQLQFSNILILIMDHSNRNDAKSHINIDTTGSGSGYYIYGGKMIEINWSKASQDSPISYTDNEGYPLVINKGKTAVNIISPEISRTLKFNLQ